MVYIYMKVRGLVTKCV